MGEEVTCTSAQGFVAVVSSRGYCAEKGGMNCSASFNTASTFLLPSKNDSFIGSSTSGSSVSKLRSSPERSADIGESEQSIFGRVVDNDVSSVFDGLVESAQNSFLSRVRVAMFGSGEPQTCHSGTGKSSFDMTSSLGDPSMGAGKAVDGSRIFRFG